MALETGKVFAATQRSSPRSRSWKINIVEWRMDITGECDTTRHPLAQIHRAGLSCLVCMVLYSIERVLKQVQYEFVGCSVAW